MTTYWEMYLVICFWKPVILQVKGGIFWEFLSLQGKVLFSNVIYSILLCDSQYLTKLYIWLDLIVEKATISILLLASSVSLCLMKNCTP